MIGEQSIPLEQRYHRLEITNRWIVIIAVIAVGIAVALGAWVFATQSATQDAEQTVTDVTTAWAEADADLIAGVYAEDAVIVSGGSEYRGLEEIQGVLPAEAGDFVPELAGPVVEYGDTIAAPIHFTWPDGSEDDAVSIFQLNDEGLIVYHEDFFVAMPAD